jgi:hypothetical protein
MRKVIPAVLAAAMFLPALPAAAAGSPPALSDLTGHWARPAIEAGLSAGYVAGFPDGRFRPDQPITRAEFFKLLTAALNQPLFPGGSAGLTDTNHWVLQQGYAQAAVRAGFLNPVDYGRLLAPDTPVTRREMVMATVRALGKGGLVNEKDAALAAADAAAYPAWLRGWAAIALADGIVTGYPDGTLELGQTATRAEALVMIQRVLGKVTDKVQAAIAPTDKSARRYPVAGEPEWFLQDHSPAATTVTNGKTVYALPAGARGITLMPAPGNAAWVGYTIDGATPDVMYDVIVRLEAGLVREVFKARFTGAFHYLVTVDAAGRAWFADGSDLKAAAPDGTVATIATLPSRPNSPAVFGPDGALWVMPPEAGKMVLKVSPDGQVQRFDLNLAAGQSVRYVAPMADGSAWVLIYDGTWQGALSAEQLKGGQAGAPLTLMPVSMAGNEETWPQVVGREGNTLFISRFDKTGESTFNATGFFRFDLTTGVFRPVVAPVTVARPFTLEAAPDGEALLHDQAGKFWRVLP